MKKLLVAFFVGLILSISTVTTVFAETPRFANFATRSGIVKDRVENRIDNLKDKEQQLREKAASRAADFRFKRKEIIKRFLTNALTVLSKHIDRLNKISGKIQARINKLKDKGVNVSAFQTALNNCSDEKAAAVAAIDAAKGSVAAITDNGDKDGTARAAYDSVKSAREAVRNYHKCLTDVVRIIRAANPKEATESAK